MKPSHTPGPWAVAGELDYLRVESPNSADPNACDGVRQIAIVRQSDYEIPNYGEAEANARLIAAAPDLLSALEGIVAAMDNGFSLPVEDCEPGTQAHVEAVSIEAAHAAILKAKGGAQ